MTSTAASDAALDVMRVGSLHVRHRTVRLCLVLLPIWLLGGGELGRFAWNSAVPGDLERTGAVKGRDFMQFYVAGSLARDGVWDALYDVPRLERAVERIVPAAGGQIPAPAYSPHVALLFSPLAKLPFVTARWTWFALSLVLYGLAALIVLRTAVPLQEYRVLAWLTILFNPLLAMLLSSGQIAIIGVVAWALATAAFAAGRPWLAGACLGLLAYKPTLLVGAVPVLILVNQRAVLTGLVCSVAAQGVLGLSASGIAPWRQYAAALASLPEYAFLTDTVPHQKHSLLGFFQLLAGSGHAALVLYGMATAAVLWLWRVKQRPASAGSFAAALAATAVLLSPHLYVYDLLVLMPAFVVTASIVTRAARPPSLLDRILLWCAYIVLLAPYAGALAEQTHIQVTTAALFVLVTGLQRRDALSADTWRGTSAREKESSQAGEEQRQQRQANAIPGARW